MLPGMRRPTASDLAVSGHCAESSFHIRWLVENPLVMQPAIVCTPRFNLSHGVVHDRAGCQQTKQADLGESTEAEPVRRIQALEPYLWLSINSLIYPL